MKLPAHPFKKISSKVLFSVSTSVFLIGTFFFGKELLTLNNKIATLNSEIAQKNLYVEEFHQSNLDFQKIASLSAERKKQGVEVATVESALQNTKEVILSGNFASASATLMSLNSALDSMLAEKLEKDRLAAETAKKKAEEEAKRLVALPKPTPVPTTTAQTTSDPTSLGQGYSRTTINTKNGNFTISLIKVNLAGRQVIMDSANDHDCADACPTKSLADYVSAHGATYGINGTYFCPPDYSSCAGKVSSFDFPIFNTRLGKWINQGNLYWNNRAMMTFPSGGASFYPNASSAPTGGFGAAIVSSPGLLQNGQDIVGQYSLTSAQTTKGTRGGLGINGSTLYMVVASGANMSDLAAIFLSLGATNALNIDGGGSSALWAGGYRVGPGRSLPNALVIR